MTHTVYIGFDAREGQAFAAAVNSLQLRTQAPLSILPLLENRLASKGLLRRATDLRGNRYDLASNAHASTAFAISRFLVPIIHQGDWALFTDCDVVFLADVAELFALADPRYAAMVVKHKQAGGGYKMDGQPQQDYARKNWSSVVLWNCSHPANDRLSLIDVQERAGRDLHRFYWLHDDEIGALPPEWNWLVNVEPRPPTPKIAHFTQGGPWLPHWKPAQNDDIWLRAAP